MDNLLITIIVPVYKVEPYIKRCLDSIINQTYQKLEIILVDDGSPDDCGKICDEYAERDNRIKVIHKENGGISSARNAALDIMAGDYVMFVDSDDWVEPDFCTAALKIALRENVQMVSFGYNNIYIDKNNEIVKKRERFTDNPRIIKASEGVSHLIAIDDVIHNYCWNKIYRRGLWDGVRFPEGRLYEDNAVNYLLMIRAKTIYVSDVILYNYIRRGDSITGKGLHPRAIVDKFEIWSERLKIIKKHFPENEGLQVIQIADIAVEGIMQISRKDQYGYALDEFHSFLSENKSRILPHTRSLAIKCYYYFRPLLPIYNYVRKAKHSFRLLLNHA